MRTHGLRKHSLYKTWVEMRYRCDNPKKPQYKYYGARGITYCERWKDFANFVADMGPRPDGHSLDRINNDGNYEPSNCRWASKIVQMNNMRGNRILVVDGEQMTMAEASRRWGISIGNIWNRLELGWTEEEAAKTAVWSPTRRRVGVKNARHKLTNEAVREIRTSKKTKELAEKFGVHRTLIQRIRRGVGWEHVADA